MPYVKRTSANLGEQGFKPKGRASGGRNPTGACLVAWYTAKRDGVPVKVVPVNTGWVLLGKCSLGYGQPYMEVTPDGIVNVYVWELEKTE